MQLPLQTLEGVQTLGRGASRTQTDSGRHNDQGGNKNAFSTNIGSLGSFMLELNIAKITAERHSDRIPSLEQWRAKMDV